MNKALSCLFPVKENKKRILWEITNKCNANCAHCCSKATESGYSNELNHDQIIKVLDDFIANGFNEVYFSGGEPILKEGFMDILAYARKNFSDVIFSTNGLSIDEQLADKIAEIGPNYVGISIDSINAGKHDNLRGVAGIYDKACNAVRLLSERGVKTRIGFTITKDNYMELTDIADLAKSLGSDAALYQFFLPIGRGKTNDFLQISEVQKKEVITALTTIKQNYEPVDKSFKVLYRRFYNKDKPLEQCPGGERFIYITADGRIGPCPWICKISPEYLSESNLQRSSFGELLESESIRNFRSFVKSRKPKDCEPCKVTDCGYGCPALAEIINGSFDKLDPICEARNGN